MTHPYARRADPRISASERGQLARNGIAFADGVQPAYLQEAWLDNFQLAMDAQPGLITVPNTGIPAFLANLIDPEIIRIMTTPMRAAEIYGETKKGDWTLLSVQFPTVEPVGQVTSYGDWNQGGNTRANVNWLARQSYHFQTTSRWGERELDMYGEARIQYKQEIDGAGALVINKFHNLAYFFGIANLQNYGALNDPALAAPIAPTAAWSTLDANGIYEDIRRLFQALQTVLKGNVKMDSKMTLAMSPELEVYLAKTNQYNVNVADLLKKNFPNLKIETAPEFSNVNNAGELMQLFVEALDGIKTTYTAFTEKLRAHPVIQGLSGWEQKKSAGTWGYINRRPVALVQMQGM